MAALTIKRKNQLANRFLKYNLLLNNEAIGEIKNGESKTLEFPEGTYEMLVKIGWMKSNSYTLTLQQHSPVMLEVGSIVHTSPVHIGLSLLNLALLFGSVMVYGNIPPFVWVLLLVLFLLREFVFSRKTSFIRHLFKRNTELLFIRQV